MKYSSIESGLKITIFSIFCVCMFLLSHPLKANENVYLVDYELYPTNDIVDFRGSAYFAYDHLLVRSDGNKLGTHPIYNLNIYNYIYDISVANDVLYFSADDGTHGMELWKSGGTYEGTTIVIDLNPFGDAYIENLGVVGGKVYFAGTDDVLIASGKKFYLILGNESGHTTGTIFSRSVASFTAENVNNYISLAYGAGDVNGDGFDDFLIGIGGTKYHSIYMDIPVWDFMDTLISHWQVISPPRQPLLQPPQKRPLPLQRHHQQERLLRSS
jgi:ELWxxDGT repeat protein